MTSKVPFISLSISALLMLSIMTIMVTPNVYAQELITYNSPEKGLTFSYPAGYVFDDQVFPGYTESTWETVENQIGYRVIGIMCEEEETIPSLSGTPSCASAMSTGENTEANYMGFFKVTDLDRRVARELRQPVTEQQLTTDTLFAYYIEKVIRSENEDNFLQPEWEVSEIVQQIPIPVDVINSASGQVMGQAQAELVEYEYESTAYGSLAPTFRAYMLFIIYGDTGYSIGLEARTEALESEEVPEMLQTVTDTLKLYTTSIEAIPPPAPTTPTMPTPSPPLEQQEQQPSPSPPASQLLL